MLTMAAYLDEARACVGRKDLMRSAIGRCLEKILEITHDYGPKMYDIWKEEACEARRCFLDMLIPLMLGSAQQSYGRYSNACPGLILLLPGARRRRFRLSRPAASSGCGSDWTSCWRPCRKAS